MKQNWVLGGLLLLSMVGNFSLADLPYFAKKIRNVYQNQLFPYVYEGSPLKALFIEFEVSNGIYTAEVHYEKSYQMDHLSISENGQIILHFFSLVQRKDYFAQVRLSEHSILIPLNETNEISPKRKREE